MAGCGPLGLWGEAGLAVSVASQGTRADYHRLLGQAADEAPGELPALSVHAQSLAQDVMQRDGLRSPLTLLSHLTALREDANQPTADPAMTAQNRLVRFAPTGLLTGCWLSGLVTVEHTSSELGQLLLSAYFALYGQGEWSKQRGVLYRSVLAACGVSVPDSSSPHFVSDPRFAASDFGIGRLLLQVGRLGAAHLPEVIGVHAAMTLWSPPQTVQEAAAQCLPQTRNDKPLDEWTSPQRAEPQLAQILSAYAQTDGAALARIMTGALWVLDAQRQWLSSLIVQPEPSIAQQMQDLVLRKLAHGYGFHRHVKLGNRSIDAYFDPRKPQVTDFLTALAESPWIVKGQPEQSPLLTHTTQFGGPMFGVFGDAELSVIARWIGSLTDKQATSPLDVAQTAPRLDLAPSQSARNAASLAVDSSRPSPVPMSQKMPALPQLYHRWLCLHSQPESVALARTYLTARLSEVERAGQVPHLVQKGLWPWSIKRLQHWVNARLQEQVLAAEPPDTTLPEQYLNRDEVIWLLLQLAPAALIDGAWLQGTLRPAVQTSRAASLLLRIYRDELGSGLCHQHHGNLMRKVLAEQGITLPPADSAAFVTLPQLLPASFSTPVLWLAYALHSRDFFPELLGLNLAIEMAGVGTMYSRASALLRSHQIDPYFFVLHNTIDNGATGHTAWSVEAIALYLDDVATHADAAAAAQCWQRVWRGFATYSESSTPLLRAIALRIGPKLGYRWLRARLVRSQAAEAS